MATKSATKEAATTPNKGGKAATNGAEAKPKHPSGLPESKLKVLRELNKHPNGLTRGELIELTGMKKGWSKRMGAVTKGTPAEGTLEGDGYVRSEPAAEGEGRSIRYYITKKGKSALGAK